MNVTPVGFGPHRTAWFYCLQTVDASQAIVLANLMKSSHFRPPHNQRTVFYMARLMQQECKMVNNIQYLLFPSNSGSSSNPCATHARALISVWKFLKNPVLRNFKLSYLVYGMITQIKRLCRNAGVNLLHTQTLISVAPAAAAVCLTVVLSPSTFR